MNNAVNSVFIQLVSPTLNYEVGHIKTIPVIFDNGRCEEINELVDENIRLSRADWDAFETSWDFRRHPLLPKRDGETETRNQEFLAKLARADEQLRNGQTVVKTLEELQAMEEGES